MSTGRIGRSFPGRIIMPKTWPQPFILRQRLLRQERRLAAAWPKSSLCNGTTLYHPQPETLWLMLLDAAEGTLQLREDAPSPSDRALRFLLEDASPVGNPGVVYMADERQRWEALVRCRFFLERARAGTLTRNAIHSLLGPAVATMCDAWGDPFAAILAVLALLEHERMRGLLYSTPFSRSLITRFSAPNRLMLDDGHLNEYGSFLLLERILQSMLSPEPCDSGASPVTIAWCEDPFEDEEVEDLLGGGWFDNDDSGD